MLGDTTRRHRGSLALAVFALACAACGRTMLPSEALSGTGTSSGTGGSPGVTSGSGAGGTLGGGFGGGGGSEARCDPSKPFGPASLVAGLDPKVQRYGAALSGDELTVIMTEEVLGQGLGSFDFYTASRSSRDAGFGPVTHLAAISTPNDDRNPRLSPDGLDLYFQRVVGGAFDIAQSRRASVADPFLTVTAVSGINTGVYEGTPYVAADGTTVFAVSNVAGTFDIYTATRSPADGNLTGLRAVTELNSSDREDDPVVSADQRTIFFGSNRPDVHAQGSHDLWVATRPDVTSTWSKPTHLDDADLNSFGTELPEWVSADGCTLYFSSDRTGQMELYVTVRPR